MKVSKKKLISKLEENNIFISNTDLDEVIKNYNCCLDYIGEINAIKYYDRYDFIDDNIYNNIFFDIFKCIIEFHRNGLTSYIDYCLISNNIDKNKNHYRPLSLLFSQLSWIWNYNETDNKDFMFNIYRNHAGVIEDRVWNYLHYIVNSKLISEDYKKVILIFDNISSKIYEMRKINGDYSILYDYICCVYNYFCHNGILNNDLDRAYKFLNFIYQNIMEIIDIIKINGIKYVRSNDLNNTKKLFTCIDNLYKNFDSKIKMIER